VSSAAIEGRDAAGGRHQSFQTADFVGIRRPGLG
jgi:hypothetical protein